MRKKQFLCWILLFSLLLPVSVFAAENPFTDVSSSSWYYEDVLYAAEQNFVKGMTESTFGPASSLTRAQFCTMLDRYLGHADTTQINATDFTDVPDGQWYTSHINYLVDNNIVNGMSDTGFAPNATITREQAVTILYRMIQATWLSLPDRQTAETFSDAGQISSWAKEASTALQSWDILQGDTNRNMNPKKELTRAEGVTMLVRIDKKTSSSNLSIPSPVSYPSSRTAPSTDDTSSDPAEQPVVVRPNRRSGAGYYLKNGYLCYRNEPYEIGIDVSEYQENINWAEVKADGVDFAFLRVGFRGYGSSGVICQDTSFLPHVHSALRNGIKVGVYFFSQATSAAEGAAEARVVLQMIHGYDITYPVVFDWERYTNSNSRTRNTSGEEVTAAALAFCEVIEKAGYQPMIYANPSMIDEETLEIEKIAKYPFWLAHYTGKASSTGYVPTSFRYHYDIWQYTESGSVAGINGNVDLNISFWNIDK